MSKHNHKPRANTPPNRGAGGAASSTGHSPDDHDDHGHVADGGHGSHGGHVEDASDASTLVPTRLPQLILPAIILIFVAILVAGPVMSAFSSKPAAPISTEGHTSGGSESEGVAGEASPTKAPATATSAPATPTAGANLPLMATQTAVALAGEKGDVARMPVELEFAGSAFAVIEGSGLLPDWQPPQDGNTATWIAGTFANHILYVPYNPQNEALFKAAKTGDTIKLRMNNGQVFSFAVNRSERAINGPATKEWQFSVSAAMAQDHAGVTLFLIGDPAEDRAVVQADFTGDIQSALP